MRHLRVIRTIGVALAFCAASLATAADRVTSEKLAADKACTKCHDENEKKPILSIYQTRHGVLADPATPTCVSCHGASTEHASAPVEVKDRKRTDVIFSGKGLSSAQARAGACVACHAGGKQMHWAGSEHASRDVVCSSCHVVHAAKDPILARETEPDKCFSCHQTQRAQIHRMSAHPVKDGNMGCSECHNAHGSTGPKLLVKNSVNETCFTCHAEKRGPFLWEHAPASDNCSTCHTPHGSNNEALLKARTPWLCQQCHTGAGHVGVAGSGADMPGGGAVARGNPVVPWVAVRACSNCHAKVHGSNHPSGARLLR